MLPPAWAQIDVYDLSEGASLYMGRAGADRDRIGCHLSAAYPCVTKLTSHYPRIHHLAEATRTQHSICPHITHRRRRQTFIIKICVNEKHDGH